MSLYTKLKQRESRRRMMVVGMRGTTAARKQQKRVSLVGDGSQWRITNLKKVAQAMARWA